MHSSSRSRVRLGRPKEAESVATAPERAKDNFNNVEATPRYCHRAPALQPRCISSTTRVRMGMSSAVCVIPFPSASNCHPISRCATFGRPSHPYLAALFRPAATAARMSRRHLVLGRLVACSLPDLCLHFASSLANQHCKLGTLGYHAASLPAVLADLLVSCQGHTR